MHSSLQASKTGDVTQIFACTDYCAKGQLFATETSTRPVLTLHPARYCTLDSRHRYGGYDRYGYDEQAEEDDDERTMTDVEETTYATL